MAITPLFVESMAVLKERLSLSGATQTDTTAAIESATTEVRVRLYERLGELTVSQLLAISYTEANSPTTADERKRAMANEAEVLWIKYLLLHELPTLFIDASFQTDQIWNEEGLTRRATGAQTQDLIDKTWQRLQDVLGLLESGAFGGIARAETIGPDQTPLRPGGTLFA
jgi:hypothetical protein